MAIAHEVQICFKLMYILWKSWAILLLLQINVISQQIKALTETYVF